MIHPTIRTHTITYQGQWLLINKIYSLNRFQAAKLKDGWKLTFQDMFTKAKIKPFQTFSVSLRYWSRADADGCVAGLKIAIDTLRSMGLATNDDKRFMKGI